jgi:hypothetical protein
MVDVIISQGDNKFSVWSTIVDDFHVQNLTREELVEYLIQDAVISANDKINRALFRPYMTYEECLDFIEFKKQNDL